MKAGWAIALMACAQVALGAAGDRPIDVTLSVADTGTPFPHFWEVMFGSGEAVLALRDNYRKDLRQVKAATDFKYVRFHAIFHDAVGLYDEDEHGKPIYNFSYVDQIYDGLLAAGVRPFVELSFMPKKLAADPDNIFGFWYQPYISPPKDYARWDAMLEAFARHLIERYGIDEIASWYFEVWNEPNIGFWGGEPYQSTYYELYDHSARALKRVSERLRVGGPSTAQAAWAGDFIEHCKTNGVPVDFVSSHVYSNDSSENVFGNDTPVPRDQMVCRAVRKVADEIRKSPLPKLPLFFTEYNASYANEPNITDSVYMGPWLAATVSQCDGLLEALSYWTFSDVFEEGGVAKTPFYGGFGLIATGGIPKPSFNAFALLHRLGETRLKVDSDSALATKRADGSIVLALWNYAPPDATGEKYKTPDALGPAKQFLIRVNGAPAAARAQVWRLDRDHGNVIRRFDAMGRPPFPTRAQVEELRAAAQIGEPEDLSPEGASYQVLVPQQGLALVEIR
ncbi:MAG: GH39 family glycosyl hydrolase [Steroidobacteraceae bacterium]